MGWRQIRSRHPGVVPSFSRPIPPLVIATVSPLNTAVATVPYTVTFIATGGVQPYTWSLVSASPNTGAWITVSPAGILTGTPTTSESETLTVQVTDVRSISVQKTFTLPVNAALSISTSSPLPGATVGTGYSYSMVAAGGIPPYSWTILSDTPNTGNWLSISSAGSLSGTPTTPETESLVIQVQDSIGDTVSAPYSLTVSAVGVLAFPRVMLVGVGGDQGFGRTTGYPWTTAANGTTANAAVQTIGAYDIAIISGVFEGWDSSGTYDRDNLTQALHKNATYSVTKSVTRDTLTFYYEMAVATISGNPYPQWQTLVDANNWYLFESTGGVGTKTPAGGGQFFLNISAAWPGAIGSCPIGASICGTNYGTTRTGSPTGAQGPARTFGNYAAIKLLMRGFTGDSSFSFNVQMGSPSAAGVFFDDTFVALDGAGTVPDSSLDGISIAPGSQQGGGFPGLDTVQPVLARGWHNLFDQLQTMLTTYGTPGHTYYNFANFGQYANKYQFGTATLTAGLESTLHGGLLENAVGAGASSWECFQIGNPNTGNTTYASGWPNLLANYYQGMDFCKAPKLVGVGTKLPASDGSQTASWPVGAGTTLTTVTAGTALEYQLARYSLCTTLLDDGYWAPGVTGYDWSKVRWYDELGDDSLAQVNVKRGYLGTPLTTRPTSATWAQGTLGVWSRSFTNGIAIVNPRGNGSQTVALGGTYQALIGTQQPTINNGATITSLTIGDGDGRILLGPIVDPFATRGPQAGDVYLNWNAATDGTGTSSSPWNTWPSARLQSLTTGLWVSGVGPWPDTGSGAHSGTSTNRILVKQWPGMPQGGFTFTGAGAQTGGGSWWDMVGVTLTSAYNGLCLGDNYTFSGGPGRSQHWRFIDCVGTRTGDATKTDNQGIIYCTDGASFDIQVIRGSYTGPSGEGNNQASLWFDNLSTSNSTNVTILGVLFSGSANPIYFKHTAVNNSATPGGTVKNCIFLNGGLGFRASLNYVQYINNAFQNCYLGMDEQGGGLGNSQNCTLSHNTFLNSNWLCAQDSGGAAVANNTITNNASVGTSLLKNAPFSATNPNNAIDYTANDGTGVLHYLRNSVHYTLAGYQAAYAGQEVHAVSGTIVLVSSTPGATPANWAMVSGPGKNAASDGTDCGVNAATLLTVN